MKNTIATAVSMTITTVITAVITTKTTGKDVTDPQQTSGKNNVKNDKKKVLRYS